MPTLRLPIAIAALAISATSACAPPPDASSGVPAAGCRRHLVGGPDVSYSGEPSEYENLRFWSSRDGSCTGAVTRVDMLVVAPSASDATFLCDALQRAGLDGRIDSTQGLWSVPFGSMGYVCATSAS